MQSKRSTLRHGLGLKSQQPARRCRTSKSGSVQAGLTDFCNMSTRIHCSRRWSEDVTTQMLSQSKSLVRNGYCLAECATAPHSAYAYDLERHKVGVLSSVDEVKEDKEDKREGTDKAKPQRLKKSRRLLSQRGRQNHKKIPAADPLGLAEVVIVRPNLPFSLFQLKHRMEDR
jgi:hypothetical protein